jgi:hypothetical protein
MAQLVHTLLKLAYHHLKPIFLNFDLGNLHLWQKVAEKYFRLFTVDPSQQVQYATMHFTCNAAMWLQGIEDHLDKFTWGKLCENPSKHFDRDKYV